MRELYSIDFNLVKYLEALLRLKSVTKAAHEVGITQPAMSNALAKLRRQFDDQLLVKKGSGFTLSSLAQNIRPQLDEILKRFEATFLQTKEFDPKLEEKTFNGLVSDSAGYILAPKIIENFSSKYPKIKINFHSIHHLEDLDKFDFAINSSLVLECSKKYHCDLLLKEPFAVAGCPDHFEDINSLKVSDYVKGTHYIIEQKGVPSNFIDIELEKLNYQRENKIRIPHFSIGIKSLLYTPNIVTLPISILEESSKFIPLKIFQTPFDLPCLHHHLLWHERVNNDPANKWFREKVKDFFQMPLI